MCRGSQDLGASDDGAGGGGQSNPLEKLLKNVDFELSRPVWDEVLDAGKPTAAIDRHAAQPGPVPDLQGALIGYLVIKEKHDEGRRLNDRAGTWPIIHAIEFPPSGSGRDGWALPR